MNVICKIILTLKRAEYNIVAIKRNKLKIYRHMCDYLCKCVRVMDYENRAGPGGHIVVFYEEERVKNMWGRGERGKEK